MKQHLSVLGTTAAVSGYDVITTRWFRDRTVIHRVEFLDWTVDGTALRELVRWPDGEPQEVTALQNVETAPDLQRQSVNALLGGPEVAGLWTRMPDGRVPLLFCVACYDLDCQTLTAELMIGPEVVEWREIGWQVGYEPFDIRQQEPSPFTVSFARPQYEAVLRELLA